MAPKSRPPAPSPEEIALFQEAVRDVTPLPQNGKIVQPPCRPRPVPRQTINDERRVLRDALSGPPPGDETEAEADLSYLRPGLPRQTLRKLRSGHWVIQGELDLHGLNSEEAKEHLASFLGNCRKTGLRCVRIIHGKGLRSRNREPVLKFKVRHWLRQREEILAFCEALPTDGGSGALLALLKAGRAN